MTIRPLASADVPVIADMLRSSFAAPLWPYMPYTQHGAGRFLEVAVRYPQSVDPRCLLVAADARSGIPLGFADFRLGNGGAGFLSYICVAPDARGMGFGTALFEHFLKLHPDLRTVGLDTFRDNTAARALYERWGFQHESTSAWITRPLPDAQQPPRVTDLPLSLAARGAYGFCEVRLAPPSAQRRVGVLGQDVIRCFSSEDFADDALLASVRALFPDTRTAFAVIPESDVPGVRVEHDVLLLSDRMTFEVGGGRL